MGLDVRSFFIGLRICGISQAWVGTTEDGTNLILMDGMDDVDRALSKGLVLVMSP